MSSAPDANNIRSTDAVVGKDFNADLVEVSDTLWAEIDQRYGDFAGNSLISSFCFDTDWPTWEVHPHGDEFVMLMSGAAEMILALPGGDESVRLDEPGAFVIVPKGTWHTARVREPTQMLFVTPGQGTENLEQPRRDG